MAESLVPMVTVDEFAELHRVTTRTVRRWLSDNRVPGAEMIGGKWAIPLHAARAARAGGLEAHTVAEVLATLPVMVPLHTAAAVLGVSVAGLRSSAEYFQLVRVGRSLVMPKARIRQLDGGAA